MITLDSFIFLDFYSGYCISAGLATTGLPVFLPEMGSKLLFLAAFSSRFVLGCGDCKFELLPVSYPCIMLRMLSMIGMSVVCCIVWLVKRLGGAGDLPN